MNIYTDFLLTISPFAQCKVNAKTSGNRDIKNLEQKDHKVKLLLLKCK